MLLKLAAFSMLAATSMFAAATTHMEQAGPNRVQWIYDNGANKGYVCGVVQQNGTAFDLYMPAINPAIAVKGSMMTAVPWLHFATEQDALDSITAYCPITGAPQPVIYG